MILDSDLPKLPEQTLRIDYQTFGTKVKMTLHLELFVPKTTSDEWNKFLKKTLREASTWGHPEYIGEVHAWLMIAVETVHRWAEEANRQLDEQITDLDKITNKAVYTKARKHNQLLLDRQHAVVKLKQKIEARKDAFTQMFGGS